MTATITVNRKTSLFNDANGNGVQDLGELASDGDEVGVADAGDTLFHRVTITNIGNTNATNVSFSDAFSGSTLLASTLNVSPIAFNDSFTAVGNTTLRVGQAGQAALGAAGNPSGGVSLTVSGNLLSNDRGSASVGTGIIVGDNAPGFQIRPATGASAQGGSFQVFADGSFSYINEAGDTGTDSFTYTIEDAGLDGDFATTVDNLTSTATVTITLQGEVWYVDSAGGRGSGTSASPFNSITSLTLANKDGANDTIYVKGNAAGAIVLDPGQQLIGQGADLNVAGFSLASASANSTISATANNAHVVTINANNVIAGLNIVGSGTNSGGITDGLAGSFGTLSLNPSALNAGNAGYASTISATGAAFTLSDGTIAGNGLSSTSSGGGASNVSLTNIAGTLALGGGSMTNATGPSFNVSGGTVATSYSGSVAQTSNTALVNVSGGHATGALAFTGALTGTGGTGLVFNNADGTYTFNGATTINGGTAAITISNGSGGAFTFGENVQIGQTTSVAGAPVVVANSTASITFGADVRQTNNFAILDVLNHATGTFTFQTAATLNATNGSGLQFSNADGTYNFNGTTTLNGSAVGDTGIDIVNGSAGTFEFAATTAITNPTGTAFNVDGGNGNITYNGTITDDLGQLVRITGRSGGTVDFNGVITDNFDGDGGTGTIEGSIHLGSNSGGTVRFDGGLDLSTGANDAITASANTGAALIITDPAGASVNRITTTSGTALDVRNTTIGAGGLVFESINANGGNLGIILVNTGTTAGLTVTGTGAANSGGTIQNMTGADGSIGGTGIWLDNTSNVSLSSMLINSHSNYGIRGLNVTNFSLSNSTVSTNAAGTFNGTNEAFDEGSILFGNFAANSRGLTGTATFNNVIVERGHETNFAIINDSGLLDLTMTNSQVRNTNSNAPGNSGLLILSAGTASLDAEFLNNTFSDNRAKGLQIQTGALSTGNTDVKIGSLATPGSGGTFSGNQTGLSLEHAGAGTFTFNVLNGNYSNSAVGDGAPINVNQLSASTGAFRGNIIGNNVTSAAVASGPAVRIQIVGNNPGGLDVNIAQNIITQNAQNFGLYLSSETGNRTLNATVRNNTITVVPAVGFAHAVQVDSGVSSVTDTGTVNLDIANNVINVGGGAGSGQNGIRLFKVNGTTSRLEGYGGVATNSDAVNAYVASLNTFNGGDPVRATTVGSGWGGIVSVPMPPSPPANILAPEPDPLVTEPQLPSDEQPSDQPAEDAGSAPDGDSSTGTPAPTPTPAPSPAPPPATDGPIVVDDGRLSQAELDLIIGAAIERWAAAGATPDQIAAMRAARFTVADLAGLALGESQDGAITLDIDAAGYRWFIDATPGADEEYAGAGTRLAATDATGAAGTRIDLLTVVTHELGHQIGLFDRYDAASRDALMFGSVNPGERRLPGSDDLSAATGAPVAGAFAISPVSLDTLEPGRVVTVTWQSIVDAPGNDRVIGPITGVSSISYIDGSDPPGSQNKSATSNIETQAADSLALGNVVFRDANRNGVFDTGEGASGVALTLFVDSNGNGVFDDGTDLHVSATPGGAPGTGSALTAVSGAGGVYGFSGLAPGNYIVRVDAANFAGLGPLAGRAAGAATDPDDDVDNDNNAVQFLGGQPGTFAASRAITLAFGSETDAGPTGSALDTNNRLDLGFIIPNQPPIFTSAAAQPTFTEGGAPVQVAGSVTISDDEANLAGASLVPLLTGGAGGDSFFPLLTTTPGTGVEIVGSDIVVDGVTIGSSATGTIVFNANATFAAVAELIEAYRFTSNSDNPGSANRTITFTLKDSGGTAGGGNDTAVLSRTVSVIPVDDAPVAVADAPDAQENAVLNIAVAGNDTDPDGGPKAVAKINGTAVAAGGSVTLASGAIVTLKADGTIDYNPNGKFNTLISQAKADATKAVNTTATDSFTYELNGGSQAVVTVTVNGVDGVNGAGDWLVLAAGTPGIGTNDPDLFIMAGPESYQASGGLGGDAFLVGGNLDAGDVIDGGAGKDELGIQGNYGTFGPGGGTPFEIAAGNLSNVEVLVLLSGTDTRFGALPFQASYNLKVADDVVAAGQLLTINFNTLKSGENVRFDGSLEQNGSFLTFGGQGEDRLIGGQTADGFLFGAQGRWGVGDVVDGQGGIDELGLQGLYSGASAVVFGADQIFNIEVLVLLSGGDTRFGSGGLPYAYDITMNEANLISGAMKINANTLRDDEVLIFRGQAETTGSFIVYGGLAGDTIQGSQGADEIWGRGGADILTGNGGNDVFKYFATTDSANGAIDQLTDFTAGDKVDLSTIDAIAGTAGVNDLFTFRPDGTFSANGIGGELRAVKTGAFWTVEGDTNGDGIADLIIHVTTSDPTYNLTGGDFVP